MTEHPGGGLPKARIETLVDGVFAIAMPLLVLELRVPSEGPAHRDLAQQVLALLPKLASIFMSFLMPGVSWIGHHNQYVYIRRTDRIFLWINMLFMFFIALIPFSTALLGEQPTNRVAVTVYSTNIVFGGLSLLWHWVYATSGRRLVASKLPGGRCRRYSLASRDGPNRLCPLHTTKLCPSVDPLDPLCCHSSVLYLSGACGSLMAIRTAKS